MAHFWPYSLQMVFLNDGEQAGGARAYFFQTDTLTPLTVYSDNGLVFPLGSIVQADGNGRFPPVYVDNTSATAYRFRVDDQYGSNFMGLSTVPMTSGGGGGGGGGGVDPSTVFTTGMTHWRPFSGPITGHVRMNSLSIGSAASPATERNNADTQALFQYLWAAVSDTVCPVSGGRGGSSLADFTANKTLGLPDARGRSLFGLDGMGAALAGNIPVSAIALNNTPGATGGSALHTITTAEMPVHLHGVGTLVAANESAHTHGPGTLGTNSESAHTHTIDPPSTASGVESADHTHGISITSGNPSVNHHHGLSFFVGAADHVATFPAFPSVDSNSTANWNYPDNVITADTPVHTHLVSGTSAGKSGTHTHTTDIAPFTSGTGSAHSHSVTTGTTGVGSAHTHVLSGSTANNGSGNAMINLSPAILGTWYIKL